MRTKLLFPILLLSAIAFADAVQAQQVGERLPMEQVYKRKYTATKIENFEHHVDGLRAVAARGACRVEV